MDEGIGIFWKTSKPDRDLCCIHFYYERECKYDDFSGEKDVDFKIKSF
jgi:hypothetical protein